MSRWSRYAVFLLGALVTLQSSTLRAETFTVFAAASLKETMEAAGKIFSERTGHEIQFSFASSAALAKQIENGAPADLFASADLNWMNYLENKNLIHRDTRQNRLGNELVVVAPAISVLTEIDFTREAFARILETSRLATGEVNSVPVGIYAKSAFQNLGLWPIIEPKLAQAENVRATLAFVARGEVELGVVYRTDALIDKSVKIIATFPPESHEPIVYPFALTATSQSQAARTFLTFLGSPDGVQIFKSAGFKVIAN